jgi:hypothetical protein
MGHCHCQNLSNHGMLALDCSGIPLAHDYLFTEHFSSIISRPVKLANWEGLVGGEPNGKKSRGSG